MIWARASDGDFGEAACEAQPEAQRHAQILLNAKTKTCAVCTNSNSPGR